jgi:exopolysaccharide biosynthesis predicted pyruvyltransferase EpsI
MKQDRKYVTQKYPGQSLLKMCARTPANIHIQEHNEDKNAARIYTLHSCFCYDPNSAA